MKFYIDIDGKYLGSWDGTPPDGSISVDIPPEDGRQVWDGSKWTDAPKTVQELMLENNFKYETATNALTADYPQLEKDTWPTQSEEVGKWLTDPVSATTPWINRAARERGIDREEYARRTLIKAEQFKIMSSFLTGRRQRYEGLIKNGESPELDYTLTDEILLALQEVSQVVLGTPVEDLSRSLETLA